MYRVSLCNKRDKMSITHNDRNFDVDKATHIDKGLIAKNLYWSYENPDQWLNLKDFKEQYGSIDKIEKQFYKDHFTDHVKAQNKKNGSRSQTSRNKTVDQLRRTGRTVPESQIVQIGDKWFYPNPEEFCACVKDYVRKFNEKYGGFCRILDASIHLDEPSGTPHAHIRRVWIGKDKDGHEYESQRGALLVYAGLNGIVNPNFTSKTQNIKVKFTKDERELLVDTIRSHGIELLNEKTGRTQRVSKKVYQQIMDSIGPYRQEILRLQKEYRNEKEEDMDVLNDSIKKFLDVCTANVREKYLDAFSDLEDEHADLVKKQKFLDRLIQAEMKEHQKVLNEHEKFVEYMSKHLKGFKEAAKEYKPDAHVKRINH